MSARHDIARRAALAPRAFRRRAERAALGALMSALAFLLDRGLRRRARRAG